MAASLLDTAGFPKMRWTLCFLLAFCLLFHGVLTQDNSSVIARPEPKHCTSTKDSNDGLITEMEYICPSAGDPTNHTECCGMDGVALCCALNNNQDSAENILIRYKDGIIIAVVVVVIVTVITSILIICVCWAKCPLYKYNCLRYNSHGEPLSFAVSKSDGNVAMKSVNKLPETPDRAQYKPLATEENHRNTSSGEEAEEATQNVTTVSELNTTEIAAGETGDKELECVENPSARLTPPESPANGKATTPEPGDDGAETTPAENPVA